MFKNYRLSALSLIIVLLSLSHVCPNPVDNIIGREYEGDYNAFQPAVRNVLYRILSIISTEKQEGLWPFSTGLPTDRPSTACRWFYWIRSTKTEKRSSSI